eukprot:SAG22_NODE_316_length_12517_cov_75.265180_7_plen_62_part_00
MYTLEGFGKAFIGVQKSKAIYDYMKCVALFMEYEGWSEDDAIEWMDYNVVCQNKAIFEYVN